MAVVDLRGEQVRPFLRRLLANDVARLETPGRALYSCMLREDGGVIDDLIIYYLDDTWFRMVVNAGTREKDLAWIGEQSRAFDIVPAERTDLCMIAVQGPEARERCLSLLPGVLQDEAAGLKPFCAAIENDWLVARTGYTGEDGFEIVLPGTQAPGMWTALLEAGVAPCGLGARDTLRLEAGMNLYGTDMDEDTSPLESGLGWTVAWSPEDREFLGREALEARRGDPGLRRFVGLVLEGKGVLRNHLPLFVGVEQVGEVTSGGFSPVLEKGIGLARVQPGLGDHCEVELRGRRHAVRVVKPPFVRKGKVCID
jgi:aminomethyltransferase